MPDGARKEHSHGEIIGELSDDEYLKYALNLAAFVSSFARGRTLTILL